MVINKIVAGKNSKRPKAIAKEKDGTVMYWVEELNEGGLHLRALSQLLKYNPGSLARLIGSVEQIAFLEAETVTESGVQSVELYTGENLAKVLRLVARSGIKDQAVKDRADDIRDKLVAAGFKLAVMLELAPQQLLAQVQAVQPRQLPPAHSSLEYAQELRAWGLDSDPILRSLISQRAAEELGSKLLSAAESATQVILTVRASELGYPQSSIGNGSQLGKFVVRLIQPSGKTQHGKYPVNVFDLTPELDDCIHAYFR